MDYEDAFNIGSIQLEPRLQEYMRRKKFNEENDIEPTISEEKEFCVSSYDLKMIKRFNQGKKKLYTEKRLSSDPHFVRPESDGFEELDSEHDFKKDPRYKRLQKKLQSHKDAQKQIRNFEGIDEDYTIFHQTNPYDLDPEKRPQRISKPYDEPNNAFDNYDYENNSSFDSAVMMDSRDLVLAPSRSPKTKKSNNAYDFEQQYPENRGKYCYSPNTKTKNFNTYHHPARINYKRPLTNEQVSGSMKHRLELKDIIGNLDTYNRHLNRTYDYVDTEYGSNSKSSRETQSSYQAIPFGYGNGLPNISVEESLKGGIRDSSKKSIGFRNPFEHQFDYISKDISDYRHTVNMWPQSTRGENRELARPNSASARYDKEMRNKRTSGKFDY